MPSSRRSSRRTRFDTRDDLAELAVDELTEMTGIDDERAKTLIMAARAHWFAEAGRAVAQRSSGKVGIRQLWQAQPWPSLRRS